MTAPSRDSQMMPQDFEAQPQARPYLDNPRVMRSPSPPTLTPDIQDADELSSHSSSAPDQYDQIPLGPAGAAMLQARARGGATNQYDNETAKRVHLNIQAPERVNFTQWEYSTVTTTT
uniref:Uncharacterized protein n=1 Tax=Peronospora matthiolae TaxID=2874970 RepID=A0AAV1UVC9_9STRA